jgi:hypothetical protein
MGFLRRSETSPSAEPRCVAAPLAIHCRRVSAPFALRRKERDTTTPDRSKPCTLARVSLRHPASAPGRSPAELVIPSRCGNRRRRDPPHALFPRRPPVKWVVSGRRPRVCTVRDLRICERSAAPLGFSCTDETPLAPPGAFIRTAPARRAEPEVVRAPEGVDWPATGLPA